MIGRIVSLVAGLVLLAALSGCSGGCRADSVYREPASWFASYGFDGERILVVDDVAEQREVATEMFIRLGYLATSVADGEAAVAYLKDRKVDLVVLDMIMEPGIDGLETYRQILRMHPGQRALITSGFSESDRVHEARRLGAGTYVKKPYRLHTLARAVKQVLDR